MLEQSKPVAEVSQALGEKLREGYGMAERGQRRRSSALHVARAHLFAVWHGVSGWLRRSLNLELFLLSIKFQCAAASCGSWTRCSGGGGAIFATLSALCLHQDYIV